MAGVNDKALERFDGFPAGVNNRAAIENPPRDEDGNVLAARSAVNVDFDASGQARMRRGRVTRAAGAHHSLHSTGSYLLAMAGADLVAYDDPGDGLELAQTLIAGLGDRYVSYCGDDYSTWWSNGLANGRIDEALGLHPFWPDTPAAVAATVSAAGGLAAGSYEVSVTVLDADGRESGASAPAVVQLAAGQGISVNLPEPPEGSTRWRVYRSTPDGEQQYRAAELPIAATTVELGTTTLGAALETAWLFPMPACQVIRYGHGRILGLQADALLWSVPYRAGLMHDDNVLGLRGATLLEPVGEGGEGAGWYLADEKRTYWMAGADPKDWSQVIKVPHAAVPGTSVVVPGDKLGLDTSALCAFWLGRNGTFYAGLPGGTVRPIRASDLALPVDAERGAVGYFEFEGIQQLFTTILAGGANRAAMGDDAAATVRRNGVVI